MTEDKDNFWNFIGSVALGVIGGKVLLSLLKTKCEYCGFEFPVEQDTCPNCLRKRNRRTLR